MNKWCFDEKHLMDAIKKGKLLLTKSSVSDNAKQSIKEEISVFERWLTGDFEYPFYFDFETNCSSDSKHSFNELKKMIMHEAKLCGSCFGNGYINLVSRICDNDLFLIPKNVGEIISIDDQADITMKTYDSYSTFFSDVARSIILAKKPHIQEIADANFLSYSYSSNEILNESFILLNPKEGNGILSYYVQDGIESMYPFGYSMDYIDLGPILFQLLFHDKLYEEQGIKYSTDYYELISKIRKMINNILPVLKLFQVTRTLKEDEISDDMFKELCSNYFGVDDLEYVYGVIHKIRCERDIDFIFSVLYAIDCRERINEKKIDAFHSLEHINYDYLYTAKAVDYKYSIYQKYMDEVKKRCI